MDVEKQLETFRQKELKSLRHWRNGIISAGVACIAVQAAILSIFGNVYTNHVTDVSKTIITHPFPGATQTTYEYKPQSLGESLGRTGVLALEDLPGPLGVGLLALSTVEMMEIYYLKEEEERQAKLALENA